MRPPTYRFLLKHSDIGAGMAQEHGTGQPARAGPDDDNLGSFHLVGALPLDLTDQFVNLRTGQFLLTGSDGRQGRAGQLQGNRTELPNRSGWKGTHIGIGQGDLPMGIGDHVIGRPVPGE